MSWLYRTGRIINLFVWFMVPVCLYSLFFLEGDSFVKALTLILIPTLTFQGINMHKSLKELKAMENELL